jgi:ribonuclease HI
MSNYDDYDYHYEDYVDCRHAMGAFFTAPPPKDLAPAECLYCDGCYEGGRAGIGVVAGDGSHRVSREIHATTNNEAECRALEAALRLCLETGYRPGAVYTDSELVVGWVTGNYEARSDTARLYASPLRELLRQVGCKLGWVRSEDNPADKPSKEAIGVTVVEGGCLPRKQLARLKSGRYRYSPMGLSALLKKVDHEDWATISQHLTDSREQAMACRWVCRGLSAPDAVRKVLHGRMVGNCARRSRWSR